MWARIPIAIVVLLSAYLLFLATSAAAQPTRYIYFTELGGRGISGDERIMRVNLDGSNLQTVVGGLTNPRGIEIDSPNKFIVWSTPEHIYQSRLDGTDADWVPHFRLDGGLGHEGIWGVELDTASQTVYYTASGSSSSTSRDGKIFSGPYGNALTADTWIGVGNILSPINLPYQSYGYNPRGLDLDVSSGRVYWIDDKYEEFIGSASMNGWNNPLDSPYTVLNLGVHASLSHDIALDPVAGKMYWTDWQQQSIQVADMVTGANRQTLVFGLTQPRGIAIDAGEGKMYWADYTEGAIYRANLDGSNVQTILTGVLGPQYLAIGEGVTLPGELPPPPPPPDPQPTVIPGDTDFDGDVDGVDISTFFSNFTGPGNGPPANLLCDLDGDGDVDGVDISQAFAAFTGPLAPVNIPEPNSLALAVIGVMLVGSQSRACR